MLVVLRELSKEEARGSAKTAVGPGSLERYFSLYTNDTTATVVDVTDGRARKTFNFDFHAPSNGDLWDVAVQPLLETILEPSKASQNVVVTDGTRLARECVLFGDDAGCADGIVVRAIQHILASSHVANVFLGGVMLDDDNRLTDIFANGTSDATVDDSAPAEPMILEDTKDHFTSVEEAHYQEVKSEDQLVHLANKLRLSLSETKHQVFSVIVAFDDSCAQPNTTLQFVSLAVGEMARGMKSARHCISTAAALLECRSPVMPFNGTKVSFLLKPVLCGTQPGVWIGCFSPLTFVPTHPVAEAAQQTPGISPRETFKEAFSVAQMASRIYASRIGMTGPSTRALLPSTATLPPVKRQQAEPAPGVSELIANASRDTMPSQTTGNSSIGGVPVSSPGSLRGQRGGMTTMGLVETPFGNRPSSSERPAGDLAKPLRFDVGVDASDNTDYQHETYRAAMERAVDRLRSEIRDYARQLEQSRAELGKERARTSTLMRETSEQSARGEADKAAREALRLNDELREANKQLSQEIEAVKRQCEERMLAAQQESQELQLRLAAEMSTALTKLGDRHEVQLATSAASSEEVTILKARVNELMRLVTYHQEEIRGHVDTERGYRERILALEENLRDQATEIQHLHEELRRSKMTGAEAKRRLDSAAAQQRAEESAAVESRSQADLRHQEELAQLQSTVRSLEERFRDALATAERERSRRLVLEQHQQQPTETSQSVAHAAAAHEKSQNRWNDRSEGALREEELHDERHYDLGRTASATQVISQRPAAPTSSERRGRDDIEILPSSTVERVQRGFRDAARGGIMPAVEQRPPQPPPPSLTVPNQPAASLVDVNNGEVRRRWPMEESSLLSAGSAATSRVSRHRVGAHRQHSSQSFEEFMREEPSYQLRPNVPLNFQPWTSRLSK